MFTVKSSISGSFDDFNSSFDKKKHGIKINITSGKRLNEVTSQMTTSRKEAYPIMPVIKSFLDIQKNILTGPLSVNSLLIVEGRRLKFNQDDKQQGVYLQSESSSELIKAGTIVENTNARLILLIPEVLPGKYRLLVKAVFRNSKMMRTTISKETIQIM